MFTKLPEKLKKNKRVTLCSFFITLLILIFWSNSRYPALNDKLFMGPRQGISDPLNFDPLIRPMLESPLYQQIGRTFINWLYTNWQGMTFGLMLAALVMSLLKTIKLDAVGKNPYWKTLKGSLFGAPMGVCANCATPIGQSVLNQGQSLLSAVALIQTSPTLNPIVLLMLFNLFPLHFAIAYVVANIFMIWVLTPLLIKNFDGQKEVTPHLSSYFVLKTTWGQELRSLAQDVWTSLLFIMPRTLPWMLLAGFLGSMIVHFFSFETILLENHWTTIILASFLGTLLPVPMTANIVFPFLLLKLGVQIELVFTLALTMGIFSLYPFFIIFKDYSKKVAFILLAQVFVCGIVLGSLYQKVDQKIVAYLTTKQEVILKDTLSKNLDVHTLMKDLCSVWPDKSERRLCYKKLAIKDLPSFLHPKLCEQIQDKELIAECKKSTIFLMIDHRFDIEKCEFFKDQPSLYGDCRGWTRTRKAAWEGNLKGCADVEDEFKRSLCSSYVIRTVAVNNLDLKYCQKLTSLQQIKECEDEITNKKISLSLDYKLCYSFKKDEGQRQCIYKVVADNIAKGRGKKYCESLEKEYQPHCFYTVATTLSNNKLSESFCLGLEKKFKEPCLVKITTEIPNFEFLERRCEFIEDKLLKTTCFFNGVVYLVKKNSDLTYCEKLPDRRQQANCQRQMSHYLSLEGGGEKSCERFKEKQDRLACRDYNNVLKENKELTPKLCYRLPNEMKSFCVQKVRRSIASTFNKSVSFGLSVKNDTLKGVKSFGKVDKDVNEVNLKSTLDKKDILPLESMKIVKKVQGLVIESRKHQRRSSFDEKLFSTLNFKSIGIDKFQQFDLMQAIEPFANGRGMATGDVNGDGHQDILLATNKRPRLYMNKGSLQFEEVKLFTEKVQFDTFYVSLVDIDNDGDLDLFFTTLGGANYFLLNDEGKFSDSSLMLAPEFKRALTITVPFADINRDGRLDFAFANWNFSRSVSKNELFLNDFPKFQRIQLDQNIHATTLAFVFSDINNDEFIDLLEGNDFAYPDIYRLNLGDNRFQAIAARENKIDFTSSNTMSIDTADVNNDLLLDIFTTDMLFAGTILEEACSYIVDQKDKATCVENRRDMESLYAKRANTCLELDSSFKQSQCLLIYVLFRAFNAKDPRLCTQIPDFLSSYQSLCRAFAIDVKEDTMISSPLDQKLRNVLLVQTKEGRFLNKAVDMKVANSSWSWGGKFADFNNDGYQDLYVGNGHMGMVSFGQDVYPNYLFINQKGKEFVSQAKEYNLDDPIQTPGFSYVDIDNDGDVDILASAVNGPYRLYLNNEQKKGAVTIELRDQKMNHFGIGSKIIVYTQKNQQLRELKLGNGYLSSDAPVAHFGLADEKLVNRIEVRWSDGTKTTIKGPLPANHHYVITREHQ